MINENEERFLASESLQGVLTAQMLEEHSSATCEFCLMAGDISYDLNVYSESPDSLVMIFECDDEMLSPILSMNSTEISIKCAKNTITRDLSRHDPSWDIIRIAPSKFKVTLTFIKKHTGMING